MVTFLPAFVAPFLATWMKDFVLFIDVIFSYLYGSFIRYEYLYLAANVSRWLAAFIFSAVDYNQMNCHTNAPPGAACSKKWANEAFIFLALYGFITSGLSVFYHLLTLVKHFHFFCDASRNAVALAVSQKKPKLSFNSRETNSSFP